MSRKDVKTYSRDGRSADERQAQSLEKHRDRMRKVDETIHAVKNGRSGRIRDKRAGV